jgi:hypothetical protein
MKYVKTFESFLSESHQFREVYHGTNSVMADKILSKAFDLKKSGLKSGDENALPGISTSIEYSIAQEHAEWAVEKYGGSPIVLMTFVSNLNLMPGNEFFNELGKYKSAKKVLEKAKTKYDGAIMFDYDSEEGLEEFEINIFEPNNLKWSKT